MRNLTLLHVHLNFCALSAQLATNNGSLSVRTQWGCGSDGRDLLVYNENKKYISWKDRLLDYDLNLLGTFGSRVIAMSPDGERAVGYTVLFNVADQQISGACLGIETQDVRKRNDEISQIHFIRL